ncbi:MAG: hypothetical protein R3Y56_09665 [Akkermansia sp.]
MKTHYKISQLLKACFCTSFAVFTLASGSIAMAAYESVHTEAITTTLEILAPEEVTLITDDYVITDDNKAIYVDGGTLGEMAGNISVTNATGDTAGIETIDGGHVETISGDIYVNYSGASESYAYGVLINDY